MTRYERKNIRIQNSIIQSDVGNMADQEATGVLSATETLSYEPE